VGLHKKGTPMKKVFAIALIITAVALGFTGLLAGVSFAPATASDDDVIYTPNAQQIGEQRWQVQLPTGAIAFFGYCVPINGGGYNCHTIINAPNGAIETRTFLEAPNVATQPRTASKPQHAMQTYVPIPVYAGPQVYVYPQASAYPTYTPRPFGTVQIQGPNGGLSIRWGNGQFRLFGGFN